MPNVDAVFKYLAQDYFVIVIKRAFICLIFRYRNYIAIIPKHKVLI